MAGLFGETWHTHARARASTINKYTQQPEQRTNRTGEVTKYLVYNMRKRQEGACGRDVRNGCVDGYIDRPTGVNVHARPQPQPRPANNAHTNTPTIDPNTIEQVETARTSTSTARSTWPASPTRASRHVFLGIDCDVVVLLR